MWNSMMHYPTLKAHLRACCAFWTKASRDPAVWQTTVAPYRRYQALFAGIIRQAVAEGSVAEVDADAASRVVLALALGLILQSMLDRDGADWEQVAQEGMQLILKGLSH
jgi:AcrR family transcriptional regulator